MEISSIVKLPVRPLLVKRMWFMQDNNIWMHVDTFDPYMHGITYNKVCRRVIGCNYNLLFDPITIIMVLHLHMRVE